jgi:hypothetical protein
MGRRRGAIVSTEGIAKANLSSACHGKLQAQSQIGDAHGIGNPRRIS